MNFWNAWGVSLTRPAIIACIPSASRIFVKIFAALFRRSVLAEAISSKRAAHYRPYSSGVNSWERKSENFLGVRVRGERGEGEGSGKSIGCGKGGICGLRFPVSGSLVLGQRPPGYFTSMACRRSRRRSISRLAQAPGETRACRLLSGSRPARPSSSVAAWR